MFDQAMARIAGRFRRVEPRATARAFVLGLLSGVERKNCWQLAEQAGHTRPGPMQRLLRSARWDAVGVRTFLPRCVQTNVPSCQATSVSRSMALRR
ncbi:IS701 family transposase, partial [Streptomyces sp. NPDC058286]